MNPDDPKKRPPAPKPIPVTPVDGADKGKAKPVKPVPVKPVPVKPVSVKPVPVNPVPIDAGQARPPTSVPVKPVPVKPIVPKPVTPDTAPKNPAAKVVPPSQKKPKSPTPVKAAPVNSVPVTPVPVTPTPVQPAKPRRVKPVFEPVPVAPAPVVASRPIPVAAPSSADELSMLGAKPESPSEEDEDVEVDVKRLKRAAPPWLTSTIVHLLVVLIAGFWLMPRKENVSMEIEATFAEVEPMDDVVDLFTEEDVSLDDEMFAEELVVESVDDPFAAPIDVLTDLSSMGTPTFAAPVVGRSLNGRNPGMRKGLLKAYGGTKKTETSVKLGLAWLKRNIDTKTGGWSLVGPYKNGGTAENPVAATAMAVLAFQGAGHTTMEGGYKTELRRAWKYLLSRQRTDGKFELSASTPNGQQFYTHAQATIALCELYALTKQKDLEGPAQSAVDYLLKTQGTNGGWRYDPNAEGDLSVTGWVVMALQSARMGGLNVPEESLDRIRGFLDLVSAEEKSKYSYLPNARITPTMTAEGLLCRQYLGWEHDTPALLRGTEYVSQSPIQWREPDVYYWYYATQVMHHMEGKLWEDWNNVMREEIPNHQVAKGQPEGGSWFEEKDNWANHGGRLYSTCLSLFMLEVYYRHLPLYNSVYGSQ